MDTVLTGAPAVRASVVVLVQKNAPQALAALRSVRTGASRDLAYEIVVLLNGADDSTIAQIQRSIDADRVLISGANLGFGGGCNWVAQAATRGEYLVFLNDDTIVDPGWLEALVAAADGDPEIAAVGSRIRFADGTLQEAGSIVWQGGSTAPVGRGLPADGLAWRFRRDVTYASACSLLVRRSDFEAVGGFDEAYYPAYYEDVDLCLKLLKSGKRVVYEPRSELIHHESQSSTSDFKSFLIQRSHRRFALKWHDVLERDFERAEPWDPHAVRRAIARARGPRLRVLIIDDRLPDATIGSGFGRTVELVRDLHDRGFAVRMFASGEGTPDPVGVSDFEVEVVTGSLEAELRDPNVRYDVAIISRPNNFTNFAHLIRRHQPQCKICYDVESLFYRRLEKQQRFVSDPMRRASIVERATAGKALETEIARSVDRLVCISREERAILESIADCAPTEFMLPLARGIVPTTRAFADREPLAIFVAGWLAGPEAPNADGLIWFANDVLPLVVEQLPWFRTLVTGASPPANVARLASPHLIFSGYVGDLREIYACARIAISPIRFGAGVKIKTVEAIQFGVPVIATTVGGEGIEIANARAIEIADDPVRFADSIMRAIGDETDWNRRRDAAFEQLERWKATPSVSWADVCRNMLSVASTDAPANVVAERQRALRDVRSPSASSG